MLRTLTKGVRFTHLVRARSNTLGLSRSYSIYACDFVRVLVYISYCTLLYVLFMKSYFKNTISIIIIKR